jgi:predicted phosphodiesterase
MCPGNHDITAGADAFKLFNQVAHVVSADTARLFSSRAPIWVQHIGGVTFLALNSAHHADHTYGLIDLNTLNGIEIPSASGPRIAVIHHNLVGIHPRDTSTVRNAYAFLHRVVTDRFDVVLHGHQHSMQLLRVGDAHIVGAGSLNLAPLRGLPNQFNLLIWTPRLRIERYSFSHDGSSKGRIGGWHGTTLFPSRG